MAGQTESQDLLFHVVIPARYGSQRLPGKPLRRIAGFPMVGWVCQRALASGATSVTVATDNEDIAAAARQAGAKAVMTNTEHASGTDRLAEVVRLRRWPDDTVVVNVQGDEPAMPPELIRQVAALLQNSPEAGVSTLCTPLESAEEWQNTNVVKVLRSAGERALYFSRAPIPFVRDPHGQVDAAWKLPHLGRHLGLYAYRVSALRGFSAWPVAGLEALEKLEQLRFMEHDVPVCVAPAVVLPGPGVDTAEDLSRVSALAGTWQWESASRQPEAGRSSR